MTIINATSRTIGQIIAQSLREDWSEWSSAYGEMINFKYGWRLQEKLRAGAFGYHDALKSNVPLTSNEEKDIKEAVSEWKTAWTERARAEALAKWEATP